MGRRKVVTEPLMEGMIEVTKRNKKRLESKYGIEIPNDVTFILPPTRLLEEAFWRSTPTGAPHFQELIG